MSLDGYRVPYFVFPPTGPFSVQPFVDRANGPNNMYIRPMMYDRYRYNMPDVYTPLDNDVLNREWQKNYRAPAMPPVHGYPQLLSTDKECYPNVNYMRPGHKWSVLS